MNLINGQPAHQIDVFDRGLQYGDGLFETIEIKDGNPVFLRRHLSRLTFGCQKLGIPGPDLELIASEIKQLIQSVDGHFGTLKLTVTRGISVRGYRSPPNNKVNPTRILSFIPTEQISDSVNNQRVNTVVCKTRLSLNPSLAGIKHLNRLEQVLARSEWQNNQIHEGIMLSTLGHVIEGTMTNVFWVKNGILYSPDISKCGIAGIIREVILEAAQAQSVPVRLVLSFIDELFQADEIFLTNSIIGLWSVERINERIFQRGLMTDLAEQWIEQCKLEEISTC